MRRGAVTPEAGQPGRYPGHVHDLPGDPYLARALPVLRARPAALVTDIDGTLSPIAPSPEEAEVLPGCRKALADLAKVLHLVAVVSGRRVEEAHRMVGLDQLTYIGNHGLERWDSAGGYRSEAEPYAALMAEALRALRHELQGLAGVRLEDKESVISIHYRASPNPAAARQAILEASKRVLPEDGPTIAEGKKVIEVRPPLAVDKGTVVRGLVREHDLRGIVYLGDDLTDVDAFRAVRDLREEGEILGLTTGVGGAEVPDGLVGVSDILLPGPQAASQFLQALAQALSQGPA
jgi:trehalose 6-phosphate phosphatase